MPPLIPCKHSVVKLGVHHGSPKHAKSTSLWDPERLKTNTRSTWLSAGVYDFRSFQYEEGGNEMKEEILSLHTRLRAKQGACSDTLVSEINGIFQSPKSLCSAKNLKSKPLMLFSGEHEKFETSGKATTAFCFLKLLVPFFLQVLRIRLQALLNPPQFHQLAISAR